MRVYDLPLALSDRSRRVGVIGSCRVHEPFVILAREGRVRRVWSDNAVTHTTADALQNLRILAGAEPPKVAVPLIYEPPEVLRPTGSRATLLETVDTFLVEISDRTLIRYRDWSFQINFLLRNFIQLHPAALFGWYKDLTTVGVAGEASIERALGAVPVSGPSERAQLEDLLRHTRMHRQTPAETAAGVSRLAESAPGRWIFVSHFAIPGDEGTLMTDRRALIAATREGAEASGAEVFDPSVLVERHGRETALAADGADPYEYAEPFNRVVADAFCTVLADGKKPGKAKPKEPAAFKAVDETLTALHAERLRQMGPADSGLYEYYADLVGRGSVFHPTDVDWFNYLTEYLAPQDQYLLLRAGLGELGFALALAGRRVVLWEPNLLRRTALEAGLERLAARYPKIRGLVTVAADDARLEKTGSTLAVGVALSAASEGDSVEAAGMMAQAEALLYSPGRFLRLGDGPADAQAMALLRKAGFRRFELATLSGAVIARRTD